MNPTRRRLLSFLLLPLLVGTVALARPVKALTLVPPSLEYDVNPGQIVSGKIKLYNEGTAPTTVFASAANFTAKGEDGTPNFQFSDTPTDLTAWMALPKGGITLNAGDRLEVPFTITVPADADPGGHYASVFFGTDPSIKPEGGGQVNIRSLIGTLVILRVSGEVNESAIISEVGVEGGHATLSRLPATLFARIQNTGNVHVRPEGTVTIRNLFGGESAHLTFNDVNGAVLPRSTRRFDVMWSRISGNDSERGGFFSEIGAEWRNFALGPYTATLTLSYGESSKPLSETIKFTVFPWRLLLIEFLALALLVFLIVFGIRRYNAAIIRRAKDTFPPTKK